MLRPVTWDELKTYDRNPPTGILERESSMKEKYDQHRKNVKDINSYLMDNLFANNTKKILFTMNDFPYWVTDDINHLVCWVRPGNEYSIDEVSEILTSVYTDFVIFENLPANKSVKLIQHFQIFVKSDGEKIKSDLEYLNKWTPYL
jgi:hypothetical protein